MNSILVALPLLIAQAATTPTGCMEIAHIERLNIQTGKNFIVIGERHGTNEIPHFFGELVCSLSMETPILVGLEMEARESKFLNDFIWSDGSEQAYGALMMMRHWSAASDGRNSESVFRMVERLRDLVAAGRDIEIFGFMQPAQTAREQELLMAQAISDKQRLRPDTRVVALIGDAHAELGRFEGNRSMADHLPRGETITLSYVPWELCERSFQCHPKTSKPELKILSEVPPEINWRGFDIWYTVGRKFTPSPSMKGGR